MKQVVQLERDEDLASIRSRFESVDFSQVVLVVPRDYPFLGNDTALQLLRRAAQDAGVEVGLVTRDLDLSERARALGIPAFDTVGQARRNQWRMPSVERIALAAMAIAGGREGARGHRATQDRSPRTMRELRLPLVLVTIGGFFFCIAAFLFVPAANVRIVPASIPLALSTEITIDPTITAVNSGTRSVPARRIIRPVTASAQARTSTTRNLPDARAAGTVTFTNLREEETLVPQGAVVRTSAGVPIRFTTTTTVTIPAGANNRVEAAIQAIEPGPAGNVRELAINVIEGSLNLEARVINLRPMASGTVRPVRVVTTNDRTNLEAQVLQQLKVQAGEIMAKQVKEKEFVPPDSIVHDIRDKIFDRAVDDPADVLNLKMTADAYALAVDPDDVALLVRALLQRQLQSGYQMLPGGIVVESLTNGKYQGPALKILLRAVGHTTPQIDPTKVSRALQGKTASQAAALISSQIQLAQPPTINISPPGWFLLPWFSFRIAVFVEPQTVTRK